MKKMRRTYVQPTSEVVELHVTNQLLAGSVDALDSFDNGGDPLNQSAPEWDELEP